jgi:uncharacterized protein YjbI with pentapeptide repeats
VKGYTYGTTHGYTDVWDASASSYIKEDKVGLASLSGAELFMADLSYTDLLDADLSGANLGFSNLSGSNLRNADLNNANLRDANLQNSDLRNAEFHLANLNNANFQDADLTGSNFTDANLRNADFTNANLTNAIFTGADLTGVNFTGANIYGATGLVMSDSQRASAISTLSTDTIEVSETIKSVDVTYASSVTLESGVYLSGGFIGTSDWANTMGLSYGVNADFSNVDLSGADLSGITLGDRINLSGVNLSGADLSNADLSALSSYWGDGPLTTVASLRDANLSSVDFGSWSDLSGLDLTGANLSDALLNNPDFSNASLVNAILHRVELRSGDLTNADLTNADFTGAILVGATFENTILTGANFSDVDMSYTTIKDYNMIGLNFMGATLSRSHFSGSDFSGSNFTNANLSYTDLSNANLTNVDFTGARLEEATLTGANIYGATGIDSGVDLSGTVSNEVTPTSVSTYTARAEADMTSLVTKSVDVVFVEAVILKPGANFKGGTVDNFTDFGDVDLRGANLSNADISGADLSDVNLRGANLDGADLSYANLKNTLLDGANMSNANLTGVNAQGAKLTYTDFSNANLTNAILANTNLQNATFDDANLTNTILTGANIYSAGGLIITSEQLTSTSREYKPETDLKDYLINNITFDTPVRAGESSATSHLVNGNELHYFFYDGPYENFDSNGNSWTTTEWGLTEKKYFVDQLFPYLEGIVNLKFVEAGSADSAATVLYSYGDLPGQDNGVHGGWAYNGDAYFADLATTAHGGTGGMGDWAMVATHEFLHTLGIDHGTSDQIDDATAGLSENFSSRYASSASYGGSSNFIPYGELSSYAKSLGLLNTEYYVANTFTEDQAFVSPMTIDVLALQNIYGVNASSANADNVYQLVGDSDIAIWDTAGIDAIDFSATENNAFISLVAASLQADESAIGMPSFISNSNNSWYPMDGRTQPDKVDGVYMITNGTVIENAIGGSGHDFLVGNEADNNLIGNSGNDHLVAGFGNDILELGIGIDFANGEKGNDTILLTADAVWGSGYVAKNVSNDASVGTNEKVALTGLNRFSDVIDGGGDKDSLNLTVANDAFFIDDVYSSHHRVLELQNTTQGIVSTARITNLEVINAGEGNDIVDLTSSNYILANAIEINGEAGNDILWGSNGNDTIDGGTGDDSIFGGTGSDTLTGGTGSDIFQFTATAGSDVITDFGVGGDTIQLYYRAEDNHTNADLSLASGVLTWDVDTTNNDVLIDLSATVSSSDLNDLDALITFVEIV